MYDLSIHIGGLERDAASSSSRPTAADCKKLSAKIAEVASSAMENLSNEGHKAKVCLEVIRDVERLRGLVPDATIASSGLLDMEEEFAGRYAQLSPKDSKIAVHKFEKARRTLSEMSTSDPDRARIEVDLRIWARAAGVEVTARDIREGTLPVARMSEERGLHLVWQQARIDDPPSGGVDACMTAGQLLGWLQEQDRNEAAEASIVDRMDALWGGVDPSAASRREERESAEAKLLQLGAAAFSKHSDPSSSTAWQLYEAATRLEEHGSSSDRLAKLREQAASILLSDATLQREFDHMVSGLVKQLNAPFERAVQGRLAFEEVALAQHGVWEQLDAYREISLSAKELPEPTDQPQLLPSPVLQGNPWSYLEDAMQYQVVAHWLNNEKELRTEVERLTELLHRINEDSAWAADLEFGYDEAEVAEKRQQIFSLLADSPKDVRAYFSKPQLKGWRLQYEFLNQLVQKPWAMRSPEEKLVVLRLELNWRQHQFAQQPQLLPGTFREALVTVADRLAERLSVPRSPEDTARYPLFGADASWKGQTPPSGVALVTLAKSGWFQKEGWTNHVFDYDKVLESLAKEGGDDEREWLPRKGQQRQTLRHHALSMFVASLFHCQQSEDQVAGLVPISFEEADPFFTDSIETVLSPGEPWSDSVMRNHVESALHHAYTVDQWADIKLVADKADLKVHTETVQEVRRRIVALAGGDVDEQPPSTT